MARKQLSQQAQSDAEETRQTILRVAYHLFMSYGYRAVTTRQLAEACGLTQPALYHYFPDKQALYLAVVTEDMSKFTAAIERITRRSDTVTEQLKHVASFLLGRFQYDLSLMLHDVRYELSADARALLDEQFRNGFILPLATIFEQGIQQNALRGAEQGGLQPIPAAYLFMTMLSATVRRQQEEVSRQDRLVTHTASAETLVQILLHGLAV